MPPAPNHHVARSVSNSVALLALGLLLLSARARGAPIALYETDFESPAFTNGVVLHGQDQWEAYPEESTICSQIVTNYLPGHGQQALLGYFQPEPNTTYYASAFRVLDYNPVPNARTQVEFQVTFAVVDSVDRPERDSFRWIVYNRNIDRLLSLDFNNATGLISYALDDDAFESTQRLFDVEGLYTLRLVMNFASNVWTAVVNNEIIVNAAPLTTQNRSLDLGDIDAVWIQTDGNTRFGDNYMLFDNFRVTADVSSPLPSEVQMLPFSDQAGPRLRVIGEPGRRYALEATTDFLHWTSLTTNAPSLGDGTFQFVDNPAAAGSTRFYRARSLGP